jgi:hypothetical protein
LVGRGLFIALMMEALRTSESSFYFNETTRRHIPEGCHLHTRRCEILKSYLEDDVCDSIAEDLLFELCFQMSINEIGTPAPLLIKW